MTAANKYLKLVIAVSILTNLTLAGFFGYQWYTKKQESQKPKEAILKPENLVAQVDKLIVLPTGETPIIATVSDVETLKQNQPFFVNAKNGDKVLIYQEAKKAFLYDPISDKIVDVGFVNFSNQSGLKKDSK